MNFQEAIKKPWQIEFDCLEGAINLDLYPAYACKTHRFQNGMIHCSGNTFTHKIFENISITGSAVFQNCTLKGCDFQGCQGERTVQILGGRVIDTKFYGTFWRFDFIPDFAKGVHFESDFFAYNLLPMLNCSVMDGVTVAPEAMRRMIVFMLRSIARRTATGRRA